MDGHTYRRKKKEDIAVYSKLSEEATYCFTTLRTWARIAAKGLQKNKSIKIQSQQFSLRERKKQSDPKLMKGRFTLEWFWRI
jgi:hypothetical protein